MTDARWVEAPTRHYPAHRQRPIRHLGEWLVRRGLISRADLFVALDACYRHDCRVGDALVWLEILDRPAVEAEARRFACFCNPAGPAGPGGADKSTQCG